MILRKYICENCKKEFPARECDKRGKRVFCSMKCQHEWRVGKTNTTKKKGIYKNCPICDKVFYCYPSEQKSKKTCSRECKGNYENLKGIHQKENCNFWKGGYDSYRGKNWYKQRNEARKRDSNTCQICGKTEKEQGYSMIVHHIVPFRFFVNDYKEANKLINLKTVCHNCHAKQESHQWDEVPREYVHLLGDITPTKKPPAGKRYSKSEVEFIKKNYTKMQYKDLADIMGRTKNSVADKILTLGLRKRHNTERSLRETEGTCRD